MNASCPQTAVVRLMEFSDMALVCGVTNQSVRPWGASGELRVIRLTKRVVRIDADEARGFIRRSTYTPAHEPVDDASGEGGTA